MEYIATPHNETRYRVERKLGAGAKGEVVLATDTETNQTVAIKILSRSELMDSKRGTINLIRFHNEFNALKHCNHPAVIKVFDFYEHNHDAYFTMEYCEGRALDSVIQDKDNPPTINQAISYLAQIAEGLAAVHECGLTHRDLKPANIFVTADHKIKLLDFGIARVEDSTVKLTVSENALGTFQYMAPECFAGGVVDKFSDIYAFGILAFELLTGELPYDATAPYKLLHCHTIGEIPSAKTKNPQIPDWLSSLVYTCMEKEKPRRYQSMLEIIAVIAENCPDIQIDETLKPKIAELTATGATKKHQTNIRSDKRRETKESIKKILLVFCLTMFFTFLWLTPIGTYSNILLLRTLFAIRGPIDPPKDVVIVALDDLTYQHFGVSTRKPFPRKYWAQALEKIHATKPKVVIIDGYFQPEDDDEDGDAALEAAIAKGPTVLMKWEEPASQASLNQNDSTQIKHHSDPRFSKTAFMEIAPFFKTERNMVTRFGNRTGDSRNVNDILPIRQALEKVGLGGLAKPKAYNYINYYGDPGRIATVSMYKVISQGNNFEGKTVLIGCKSEGRSDVPGSYDLFFTSGSLLKSYFGVEIHATIVGNIISGSYIRCLPRSIEALLIGLSVAFLLMFLTKNKPAVALRYCFLIFVVWFGITVLGFNYFCFVFPGVSFLFFIAVFVCSVSWYMYGNQKEDSLNQITKRTGLVVQNG